MGCAPAKQQAKVAVQKDPPSTSVQWRVHVSANAAKDKYIEDGTLSARASDTELAFRALLDDKIARHFLRAHLVEKGFHHAFDCWMDVMDFKNTRPSKLQQAKAARIFERYVRRGRTLSDALVDEEDVLRTQAGLQPLGSINTRVSSPRYSQFVPNGGGSYTETSGRYVNTRRSNGRKSSISTSRYLPNSGGNNNSQFWKEDVSVGGELDPLAIPQTFYDWLQRLCFGFMHASPGYLDFVQTHKCDEMNAVIRKKYNHAKPSDFEYIKVLGEGGFGMVVQVYKKSTGINYAMKLQRKENMYCNVIRTPWRVDLEKQAFASCDHPFVAKLWYAFQTSTLAMLVMSLGTAGDLNSQLRDAPSHQFDIPRARFYAAEITCALAYLHNKGLLYRDLKPSNVLLNADGHIQLVDFGAVIDVNGGTLGVASQLDLVPVFASKYETSSDARRSSKFVPPSQSNHNSYSASATQTVSDSTQHGEAAMEPSHPQLSPDMADSPPVPEPFGAELKDDDMLKLPRAMSIIGTMDYMAPEMLLMLTQKLEDQVGYTKAVDWWSLGVTLYKMLTGRKTFKELPVPDVLRQLGSGEYTQEEREKCIQTVTELYSVCDVDFSTIIDDAAVDFIVALLDMHEGRRLGGDVLSGSLDVMSHPFFADVDWVRMDAKQAEPPYVPRNPKFRVDGTSVAPLKQTPSESWHDVSRTEKEIDSMTTREVLVGPQFASLEELLEATGHSDWQQFQCKRASSLAKMQWHFEPWGYSSAAAIVMESEAARRKKKKRHEQEQEQQKLGGKV